MELVMVGPEVCWRPFPEMGEGAVCSPGHSDDTGICEVEAPGVQVAGSVVRIFTTHQMCPEVQGASSGGAEGLVTDTLLQLAPPTWSRPRATPSPRLPRKEGSGRVRQSAEGQLGLFFPQTALSAFFQETNIPYSHHHHQMVSVPCGLRGNSTGSPGSSCGGSRL